MGLRINHNISALASYNSLNKTDKAVSSSLEKLSSGYRINKAADDAAGLVVSEGLRSQIGGLTVAARNAQDGVNVAQTADGALGTATDILQRMRDLAVQAANAGSQDSTAQAAANKEFSQLSNELGRIASTTSFGGQQLLDGTYNGQFQIGSNNTSNDRLGVDLTSASSLFTGSTPATAQVKASATFTNAAISALTVGDTITVGGASVSLTSASPAGLAQTLNGNTTFANTYTASVDGSGNLVVAAKSGLTGQTIDLKDGSTSVTATTSTTGTTYVKAVGISGFNASGLGLSGIDLTSAANAQAAIDAVSNALAGVSNARASIGAIQNRFEHSIDNLNTSIQNITASESAIRDTDMASEMTKFTKNQVLSQAGTSMLAQANSSTQNILTLLRG